MSRLLVPALVCTIVLALRNNLAITVGDARVLFVILKLCWSGVRVGVLLVDYQATPILFPLARHVVVVHGRIAACFGWNATMRVFKTLVVLEVLVIDKAVLVVAPQVLRVCILLIFIIVIGIGERVALPPRY